VNGASYANAVAPGATVSIFGDLLADHVGQASEIPLPDQLSNVQVLVDSIPAPMFYVSPRQINAQIPFGIALGSATVEVRSKAGGASIGFTLSNAAPGIFSVNMQGSGPGAILHGATLTPVTDSGLPRVRSSRFTAPGWGR